MGENAAVEPPRQPQQPWMLDELAHAGPEHLEAR
jgi:hypothetical protein